ncbi:MAG: hypothetical protein V1880_03710, partial [Patescibacteria group bacterium]
KTEKTILNNIYFLTVVYYVLVVSYLPLNALIFQITSNLKITAYFADVLLLFVFIMMPLFIFIRNALRIEKYTISFLLSLILMAFFVAFPIGFAIQLGLYAIGHYDAFWFTILNSAKLGTIFGLYSGVAGLLINFVICCIKR